MTSGRQVSFLQISAESHLSFSMDYHVAFSAIIRLWISNAEVVPVKLLHHKVIKQRRSLLRLRRAFAAN